MKFNYIVILVKYLITCNDMYIMYTMYKVYVIDAWRIRYV